MPWGGGRASPPPLQQAGPLPPRSRHAAKRRSVALRWRREAGDARPPARGALIAGLLVPPKPYLARSAGQGSRRDPPGTLGCAPHSQPQPTPDRRRRIARRAQAGRAQVRGHRPGPDPRRGLVWGLVALQHLPGGCWGAAERDGRGCGHGFKKPAAAPALLVPRAPLPAPTAPPNARQRCRQGLAPHHCRRRCRCAAAQPACPPLSGPLPAADSPSIDAPPAVLTGRRREDAGGRPRAAGPAFGAERAEAG